MQYFRVNKEYDGVAITHNQKHVLNLVKNELFTKRELERNHIPARYVVAVEVSKKEVYWLFGARSCQSVRYSN